MPTGPRLLDTVTLSEVIKGRDLGVLKRAREYLSIHGRFQFSIITRYEILRGLKAKAASRQVERFEEQCQASLVFPLSDEIVVRAAEIYGLLHRRGTLIQDADILIAATALVHGLELVTENPSHFSRIPDLVIEGWRST
ncbi:MAG TPA: type II toxin-antitoxin system VapC family toxin [Thermoanaerobaculia bacterium]|jgi:tRNA(fMet)-specific endonuclease VapC|nr:type II toxin-antitoxin system VapC family toxin [Thermoanaerobaculia bacterium]